MDYMVLFVSVNSLITGLLVGWMLWGSRHDQPHDQRRRPPRG